MRVQLPLTPPIIFEDKFSKCIFNDFSFLCLQQKKRYFVKQVNTLDIPLLDFLKHFLGLYQIRRIESEVFMYADDNCIVKEIAKNR